MFTSNILVERSEIPVFPQQRAKVHILGSPRSMVRVRILTTPELISKEPHNKWMPVNPPPPVFRPQTFSFLGTEWYWLLTFYRSSPKFKFESLSSEAPIPSVNKDLASSKLWVLALYFRYQTQPYNVSRRRTSNGERISYLTVGLAIKRVLARPIDGLPRRTFRTKGKLSSAGSTRLCISHRVGYLRITTLFYRPTACFRKLRFLRSRFDYRGG